MTIVQEDLGVFWCFFFFFASLSGVAVDAAQKMKRSARRMVPGDPVGRDFPR